MWVAYISLHEQRGGGPNPFFFKIDSVIADPMYINIIILKCYKLKAFLKPRYSIKNVGAPLENFRG